MFAQINWAILSPHENGLGVYKVYCMGIARDLPITCPHNFQVLPAPMEHPLSNVIDDDKVLPSSLIISVFNKSYCLK